LSFFAFNPANIHNLRYNVFYLIDWGFDYQSLRNMPLEEFYEYIELLNKQRKRENDAMNNKSGASIQNEGPKMVGDNLPGDKR
jgi:hypothetical protein